jgi:hypothetical protein
MAEFAPSAKMLIRQAAAKSAAKICSPLPRAFRELISHE